MWDLPPRILIDVFITIYLASDSLEIRRNLLLCGEHRRPFAVFKLFFLRPCKSKFSWVMNTSQSTAWLEFMDEGGMIGSKKKFHCNVKKTGGRTDRQTGGD